jgi:hypothetical protein
MKKWEKYKKIKKVIMNWPEKVLNLVIGLGKAANGVKPRLMNQFSLSHF